MDKRAHDRTKLWFPVTVVCDDRSIWAVCYDASAGGMRLSCSQPLAPSSSVTLVFRVTPDDPVEHRLAATILRTEPNTDAPAGPWPLRVALAFAEPQPALGELFKRSVPPVPSSGRTGG